MTVKDLKKFLEDKPDNMQILISASCNYSQNELDSDILATSLSVVDHISNIKKEITKCIKII